MNRRKFLQSAIAGAVMVPLATKLLAADSTTRKVDVCDHEELLYLDPEHITHADLDQLVCRLAKVGSSSLDRKYQSPEDTCWMTVLQKAAGRAALADSLTRVLNDRFDYWCKHNSIERLPMSVPHTHIMYKTPMFGLATLREHQWVTIKNGLIAHFEGMKRDVLQDNGKDPNFKAGEIVAYSTDDAPMRQLWFEYVLPMYYPSLMPMYYPSLSTSYFEWTSGVYR